MDFMKRNAVAIGVGVAVLVGGSYVGAKALTTPQAVSLSNTAADPAATPPAARGPIRGEAVIARKDGTFPTVRFNRGILQSVDGTTLVISEADGTTVNVETTSDTRFRRDGKRASLSDLKAGDHLATMAMKDGDNYVTKRVRAFSPDEWQQKQDQRAARRNNR